MALTSYADLLDAIHRWSGYGDGQPVPDRVRNAAIDSVTLAETDVNDLLRVPEMIVRSTFTATGEFASAPPNIAALISVGRIVQGREYQLRQVAEDVLPSYGRAYTGDQMWFALVGLEFRFAPAPTEAAPMAGRVTYYATVDPLSSVSPCTATFLRYPNCWLYGAMKHISLYLEDPAGQAKWTEMQAQEIAKANRAAALRDLSL